MTHFTTSGVIHSDTKVSSFTHDYRGDGGPGIIAAVDIGGNWGDGGTVHFQGDPDVMLAFVDRVRDALVASIAAYEAAKVTADA